MLKKRKLFVAEPPRVTEFDDILRQLEKILAIRNNRKEKLEAHTRELRKLLAEKEELLILQKKIAEQHEVDSHQAIKDLKAANTNRTMKVDDILYWQDREVSIRRGIEKSYKKCDEVLDQRDLHKVKLSNHLKVYRQAVMDYEKIAIIKSEIEKQRDEKNEL